MTSSFKIGQPDPEIWSGGVEGGPLIITSGSAYSEKVSYKYDLNVSPGASTGLISFSNISISTNYLIKNYQNNLYISLSNSGIENTIYVPPINSDIEKTNINLSGASTSQLVVNSFKEEIPTSAEISVFSTEKIGFSYNESSTKSFISEDFESISDVTTSFIDYGELTQTPDQGNEDYNFVFDSNELNPFGTLNISGTALVIAPPDIRTYNTGATYRVSYNPPENTSTLFTFGEKVESVTYDYNESSVIISVFEDSGSITDSSTSIDDYGLIIDPYVGQEDGGSIEFDTLIPFGSLTLSGSADTEYFNLNFYPTSAEVRVAYSPDDTEGALFTFGEKVESVTYDYNESSAIITIVDDSGSITDSSTSIDDYGLIVDISEGNVDNGSIEFDTLIPFGSLTLSGSADVIYTDKNFSANAEVRVAYSPDAEGTLFTFGEKVESITYDYNESSALITIVEDSGSITDSATSIDDYGLIIDPYVGQEDGGSIEFDTLIPFGSLTLSGSADVIYTDKNFYGNAEVRVAYSPDAEGKLFTFGEKVESVTYDYNESSILVFSSEDYSLISDSENQFGDYGLVSQISEESIDYGLNTGLGENETIYPFGNINIFGSSGDNLLTYSNDNTILFVISGELIHPNIDYTPAPDGSGTINVSGISDVAFIRKKVGIQTITLSEIGLESRTHSYNESSILSDITPSFGFISSELSETSDDYGSVTILGGETQDFGLVLSGVQTAYPYGQITISGTPLIYPEVAYIPSPDGSGIINIGGSAIYSETDAFGVGRRRGGTINLTGISTYSEVDSYVGLGTIFLDQQAEVISAVLAVTRSYVGIETIILSDAALESRTIFIPTSGIGTGFIGGTINILGNAIESFGANPPENTSLFTFSGELNHPQIDYTPHYGIEKNIGIGTTGIQITELTSVVEKFVANSPENTQLFQISGSALESTSFDTPEDTQLFVVSGTALESESEVYVGIGGTLTLSDFGIEKNTESYFATGIIEISGVVDDSAQRTSLGVGSIFIPNGFSPQESYPWLPEPGVGRSWSFTRSTYIAEPVSINITTGVALTNYYSPIYPRNALGTDPSSGIGTIRINDDKQLTFYRATLPVTAKGTIYILGIGTAANGDLDGVQIGANESFTPATEIATGLFTISGVSSNREIAVYGYYGDDKDPGTSGFIFISQQTTPIIEKYTASYFGIGTIVVSETLGEKNTESYSGSGSLFAISGASESYSAQTPDRTVDINIFGTAQESFVAQTPEDTVLYQFSGAATDEKLVKNYNGSEVLINLNGSAIVTSSPSYPSSGVFRFTKYTSDQTYDTCDSEEFTCDNQNSANISFVANPPENVVLFDINGDAITAETALYTEIAVGLYTLSGTYESIKVTHSESGIGTIFLVDTSTESEIDVYIGSGNLFALSGISESYSVQIPDSTILFQIFGSAITSIESEYQVVGIGLFTFNGVALTSEIASYTQVGSGSITLSGQLVYPDIIFIPSPDGFGTINILGSSDESLRKVYDDTSGTLFYISSGFESFTKSTYTGVGTIYIQELSGSTINNPYQIPRTYVTII